MQASGSGSWIARAFGRIGRGLRRHPVLAVAALPLAFAVYVAAHYPFTPSIGDIRKAKQEQPTVVLSADGKELATFKRANRDWVSLEEISPAAIDALLATEDHRFYEHHGIDVARTAMAVFNTLRGDVEGGSTLTQQLARNLYPEEIGREQTVTRKIKEAITALKIEAVYSKDEILETYLNSVSFLYNAWGIEMAARTYFDKPASKLNELEAATLVGMLKGTSHYNPVLNPERALQRRNTVLAQMVKHDKLPDARYERLKQQPLRLDFERLPEFSGPAPHLAQHLKRWLLDWADRHDYNIYADGLVVRTTIDSRLQALANEAVQRQGRTLQAVADVEWSSPGGADLGKRTDAYVERRDRVQPFAHFWDRQPELLDRFIRDSSRYRELRDQGVEEDEALAQLKEDAAFVHDVKRRATMLQAGFLAMDPQTGHVKAWVGSRDYEEDKFDHVQQARRQPGSTFKPFVYGAAFEMGMSPFDTFMDEPVEIRIDRNQVWRPGDVGGPTNAPMTLDEGLAQSRNSITAQLMMEVGPSRVARLARQMGVRESELEVVPSLALGTSPVTLKEMVTAFSTIANGGNYVEPVIVTSIEDRAGRVLERFHAPSPEPALSHDAAMTLIDVMRGVIETGTAVGLKSRFGVSGDLAGKTGTTQDNTDGWFILMHPELVAGAWMGFNDPRVRMRSEYWGQGAHNALLVVGDFLKNATAAKLLDAKAAFPAPRLEPPPPPPEPEPPRPLLDQMGDWWNSVFGAPPAEPPQEEVATVPPPPVALELPELEPPPTSLDEPTQLPPVAPLPALTPEAPVIVDPLRVPAFPRPLEQAAEPVETVPGTQVYPLPEPPRAEASRRADGEAARAPREPDPVLAPRPWQPPADSPDRGIGSAGADRPATSALGGVAEGAGKREHSRGRGEEASAAGGNRSEREGRRTGGNDREGAGRGSNSGGSFGWGSSLGSDRSPGSGSGPESRESFGSRESSGSRDSLGSGDSFESGDGGRGGASGAGPGTEPSGRNGSSAGRTDSPATGPLGITAGGPWPTQRGSGGARSGGDLVLVPMPATLDEATGRISIAE